MTKDRPMLPIYFALVAPTVFSVLAWLYVRAVRFLDQEMLEDELYIALSNRVGRHDPA